MNESLALIVIAGGLLAGFVAHVVGQRAHVPRVTLILLIGAGAQLAGVVPDGISEFFPAVTRAALSMVGFVIGQEFTRDRLRASGRVVVAASLLGAVLPAILVALVLPLLGVPWLLALMLAAVAPATDPAAVLDVIREARARGPLSRAVEGVVALDDAWAVLCFSILFAIADGVSGGALNLEVLGDGLREVAGGLLLGALLGLPMALVTGRVKKGQLTLIESLGFVLLAGGLAGVLEVSYLITCMTLGAVVASLARHHERPFHAIEGAMDPFIVIFFLLAGFAVDFSALMSLGLIGAGYVSLRVVGKVSGGALGARLGGSDGATSLRLGVCLLPQAGVAIGLGLVLAERFPVHREALLSLLIATTVLFELIGPLAARAAIARAGETRRARRAATQPGEG